MAGSLASGSTQATRSMIERKILIIARGLTFFSISRNPTIQLSHVALTTDRRRERYPATAPGIFSGERAVMSNSRPAIMVFANGPGAFIVLQTRIRNGSG